MTLENLAIEQLIGYFNKIEWPRELNENKIRERAKIIPNPDTSEGSLVLIERHRAILGMNYSPGKPMAAYETYSMRYSVDDSGDAKFLGIQPESIHTNPVAMVDELFQRETVDFQVIQRHDSSFLIKEEVSHNSDIVASEAEGVQFGKEIAEQHIEHLIDSIKTESCSLGLSSQDTNDLIDEIRSNAYQEVDSLVRQAWEWKSREIDAEDA